MWAFLKVCECEPLMFGEVSSPWYPQPYSTDLQEQWDLEVPKGYRIQLTINHLDIEPSPNCYYDSLLVKSDEKVLGTFCGKNSTDRFHPGHKPILAPGNRLQLIFHTDDLNHDSHLGFTAFYQAVDIDECSTSSVENESDPPCSQICLNTLGSYVCACHHGYQLRPDNRTCILDCGGGVYTEPEGTISSPGYPDPSPLDLDCLYIISLQPGFTITLSFSQTFQIEQVNNQGPTCLFHWLQVSVPGKDPEKFCGDKSPGILYTGSHITQLEYHTDRHGQSQGWSLHYTTQRVKCPNPGKISHGKVTPTYPQYLYRDYIQVYCEPGYKLMMGEKEIKSFLSMCQSNGQWHMTLPACRIIDCGRPKSLLNGNVTNISGSDNHYLSSIEYRCDEPYYAFDGKPQVRYTCTRERKWTAVGHNDIIPPCLPVCGMNTEVLFGGRVYGGKPAKLGQIPWHLLHRSNPRGAAFLISDQWALTAAHVVDGHENRTMQFTGGMIDETDQRSVTLKTEKIIIHPNYKKVGRDGHETNFNNDIALIKMSQQVKLGPNIRPLCLPKKSDGPVLEDMKGTISGFGGIKKETKSHLLRHGRVEEYSLEKCESFNLPVSDNMFCAGNENERIDSCQGDSGGALFFPALGNASPDQRYEVRGIVSWGPSICGHPSFKGYYTKVHNYLDWVRETMANN
ncbi:complement C1r-A subcomponent [Triplophysa rosa]|uniref:complement subcomponent C1r n=1 Tax=Triplophysa rosa TaxID=992332 RepID=A0A9W7WQC6_TRIRA|nr:complement C1r-A subcomponent [Triplophysa rosa]KAI7806391.1 C1rs-B [Triplophysa rosa]